MEIRLERSEDLEKEIEDKGLDLMDYEKRGGRYRIKLSAKDIKEHRDFLAYLIRKAKGIEQKNRESEESR